MICETSGVDKAHVSAEQACTQAPPRLPRPDGHEGRAQGAVAPARQGAQAPVRLRPARLKTRSEFLNVRKGVRAARPLVVIEARRREGEGEARAGFTATRRIGGAVVRNRAKRRLRAAADALLPSLGAPACDYVFIARQGTAGAAWPSLLDDVRTALLRLRPALERPPAPDAGQRPAPPSRPGDHGTD
jgi:ribonuclease P protein component